LLARLADPAERAALRALAESPDTGTGVGIWRARLFQAPYPLRRGRLARPAVTPSPLSSDGREGSRGHSP
ncbi:hypothetical protein AB0K48_47460, partial [Nonomuraea sp. NPDC055795]